MTKEIRSSNVEGHAGMRSAVSSFGFRYSFGFRHLSFGIGNCRSSRGLLTVGIGWFHNEWLLIARRSLFGERNRTRAWIQTQHRHRIAPDPAERRSRTVQCFVRQFRVGSIDPPVVLRAAILVKEDHCR